MDTKTIAIIAGAAIGLFVLLIFSSGKRTTSFSAEPDSATDRQYDLSSPVADALRAGRKIEAIKLYREEHGVGLKEAKEAVEAAERAASS